MRVSFDALFGSKLKSYFSACECRRSQIRFGVTYVRNGKQSVIMFKPGSSRIGLYLAGSINTQQLFEPLLAKMDGWEQNKQFKAEFYNSPSVIEMSDKSHRLARIGIF